MSRAFLDGVRMMAEICAKWMGETRGVVRMFTQVVDGERVLVVVARGGAVGPVMAAVRGLGDPKEL